LTPQPYFDPDVFFLPLAVKNPAKLEGMSPWVLARRIPDFLHQVINQGESGPTGMLEVQTPPDGEHPVEWVRMVEMVPADEAFAMLPPTAKVRAILTGSLELCEGRLAIEMVVHMREDDDEPSVEARVQIEVSLEDPVRGLCKLARRLARLIGLKYQDPPAVLMTRTGLAFFRFLEGLDGSALLSGDLEIEVHDDAESLMRPYSDALRLDPQFGLALRAAHFTVASAFEDARIPQATCYRLIDDYLAAGPNDGDACVQVAEYLSVMGDDSRARAWLVHASHLSPPPPKSLENLGILCFNNGETIEARNLWLDGVDVDGHPDFFAHLARLAFSEEKVDEAWEMVLRGLRRIYERSARSSEWEDHEQDLGLLLRYLGDHLQDHSAPPEVAEALTELAGQLSVPEDHLDLGHCLRHLGETELAREELAVGLASDIDGENRDEGIRGLLTMQVEDFERRFAVAVDELALEPQPEHAIEEMQVFLGVQPEFWPALFFLAVGYKRLGDEDKALDTFAEALAVSPSQPEVLFEMGELFDRRGNPKRALECIEEALQSQPDEPKLSAAMARYCERLGRIDEARVAIASAIELDPDSVEYQALRDRLFTNDS